MGTFCLLDHTADIGLQAEGDNWGDLLLQAGMALLQVVGAQTDVEAEDSRTMTVIGTDREELLVNWLNELLYCIEVHELVPRQMTLRSTSPGRVEAVLLVIPTSSVASFAHEVKAATYHRILVEEQPGGRWHARVYLDL